MAERSQTAPEAGNDTGNDDAIGGNVSKYMVLPTGYCGQPKKGHLIFDACFESGKYIKDFCLFEFVWGETLFFQNSVPPDYSE
ncbi:cytosolic carboxypeptidase 6-like [Ictidomys tridecemlineatus]|nr:cytosolic carboxypeptidase 6-like [Ictidomys tridecemlineatus]